MSDGLTEVSEERHRRGRDDVQGYCFYHGQDLERAVDGAEVMLAFGSLENDPAHKRKVGEAVKEVMESFGFAVEWSGDAEKRMNVQAVDWKRRYRA